MKAQSPAAPFLSDETGAVTADWVILTAAIVGLALAVMSTYVGPVQGAATDLAADLDAVE